MLAKARSMATAEMPMNANTSIAKSTSVVPRRERSPANARAQRSTVRRECSPANEGSQRSTGCGERPPTTDREPKRPGRREDDVAARASHGACEDGAEPERITRIRYL